MCYKRSMPPKPRSTAFPLKQVSAQIFTLHRVFHIYSLTHVNHTGGNAHAYVFVRGASSMHEGWGRQQEGREGRRKEEWGLLTIKHILKNRNI